MSVDLSSEIWNELKRYINTVDREEAAEVLVSVLVDNDVAPDDIRNSFKGDKDVKVALAAYIKDLADEPEEDEYDDDDDNESEFED
jgi:hypothetical protein|tara:strand:+ start:274 stop:531 length:258 start_codon:yes stop_codon:yes gene_type:complete